MTTPNKATKSTAAKTTATQTALNAEDKRRAETPAAAASRTAPLDLSALTVADAPAPKFQGGPGRTAADNSVAEGWLRDSWGKRDGEKARIGGGKTVTVPDAMVGTVKSRLNKAAATLGLGVAIRTEAKGDGTTRIDFAAKVRNKTKKSAEKAETAPAN